MSSLHVGVVARTLNLHHVRGTGRYVYEVLRNSRSNEGLRWSAYAHNPAMPLHLPPNFQGPRHVFDQRGNRFHLWEQWALPRRLRADGVQLLFCADNTAPIWQPVPTVVTIHDAVPWAEPAVNALEHHYLHHVQEVALRRCAHVITISESSRRDIEARWPSVAGRLTVIPHGIADEFFEPLTTALPAPLLSALGGAPYLAYLGGPMPRKRFDWALDLLARLSERPDLHLVACGFAAGTAPKPEQLPEPVRGRVHFAPFLSDLELVALFRGAQAALYPTLYEGFGFPAIEAQAASTPVLFSKVSSLVDLVGPLSWNPEPQDVAAWLADLRSALALSPAQRAERAADAREWAQGFSWQRSAERHQALFQKVAAGA